MVVDLLVLIMIVFVCYFVLLVFTFSVVVALSVVWFGWVA